MSSAMTSSFERLLSTATQCLTMTSVEQEGERPADQSLQETSTRRIWFKDRAFGLVAWALAAMGQIPILLTILFAPEDDPDSVLDVLDGRACRLVARSNWRRSSCRSSRTGGRQAP